jgi:hypothetical protein
MSYREVRVDLASEFKHLVRSDEVAIAAKELEVIFFETLLPSRVAYRPPKKIGRALSDREIQPFDAGCSVSRCPRSRAASLRIATRRQSALLARP